MRHLPIGHHPAKSAVTFREMRIRVRRPLNIWRNTLRLYALRGLDDRPALRASRAPAEPGFSLSDVSVRAQDRFQILEQQKQME